MEIPYTFAGLKPGPLNRARAAVLPVAWDGTTSWRPGARFGPSEIIMASRFLENYDEALGNEPAALGIATRPELWPDLSSPRRAAAEVEKKVSGLLARRLFPLVLGGEHSLTIGCVNACRRVYPRLSVLILDAHADLRDSYQGSAFNHACVSRRCLESGRPLTLMGVRSLPAEDLPLLPGGKRSAEFPGLAFHPAARLRENADWLTLAGGNLTEDVYLSIDLDFFDPAVVPAVGTPEPGGFGWEETVRFLGELARARRIVGCDITELDGGARHAPSSYLAARLAYRLIGLCAGRRFPL